MYRYRLGLGILFAVALAAGCGSSVEPQVSPSEPSGHAYNPEGSAPTFGAMVSQWMHARYVAPASITEAVNNAEIGTVASGVVAGLEMGRREALTGPNGEATTNYIQYYDVVIRPDRIIKGNGSANVEIHVEFVWPRNLPTDELSEAVPRGARAIVLGGRPDGAEPTDHTLLQVPPYGLVFETSRGQTALPFENDAGLEDVVKGLQSQMPFADVLAAVAGN
ncbi:MAG: hypothetical protein OEZ06_24295 [Myxococcales bacterium]|nr:hypothetical protein [Myxococcales bacterium]